MELQETVSKGSDVCYICHRKNGVCIKVGTVVTCFLCLPVCALDCKESSEFI